MRFTRDELRYLALMALDEIADECGEEPAPRSLWLRFLLAWLWIEAGADPAKKWIFTSFWDAATSPKTTDPHRGMLDRYIRSTGAQSAINGICRELGWERTVSFLQEMRVRRGVD